MIKAENQKKRKPFTAQDTIPYKEIYKDGICRTNDNYYSKMVQFYDINYQLAQNDDKAAIFENYCEFLNSFDSSVEVQITFLNQQVNFDEYAKNIDIPEQDDCFNDIRKEYSDMLKMQLSKGNNGLVKTKYITFSIKADNLRNAKSRLERIEASVLNNFKVMGAMAEPLNGVERLKILHDVMNMDTKESFHFHYGMVAKTGLQTKDFIAPTGFDFRNDSYFRMGQTFGCVSYLQITSPELTDKLLADLLDLEENLIINMHLRPIDPKAAIKSLKSTLSNIQKMKIEEQKKAVRSGYDMDIIPTDISTYGEDVEGLLNEIQSRNEKLFELTFLLMNTADNKRKLDNIVYQTAGIAQKYNCNIRRLQYQQEQGLVASLPLGMNQTGIQRIMTTTSTAIFVPFTTQELFQGGEALYYGLNALSNNLIMVDRKRLKTPNGLILGTPGSGKSFATKREILNVFLITDDDIIICDPEGEYFPLVNALNGEVIKISAKSNDYINPMEVNLDVIYHPEKYRINGDMEDIDTIIADSQYLTDDMEENALLVVGAVNSMFPEMSIKGSEPDIKRLLNSKKVSDHHAIIPTVEITNMDLKALPGGEKEILMLIASKLLCASEQEYIYESIKTEISCHGELFTASGKNVLQYGWKEVEERFFKSYGKNAENPEEEESDFPDIKMGQVFESVVVKFSEHFTAPPKHYTEDTLLSAMEHAGSSEMTEDAERKGLGTPATRAAIIEKLVEKGFIERKKKQILPTTDGRNLIRILPEMIKSPKLTAEWENDLTLIAKGQKNAEEFLYGIEKMVTKLVSDNGEPVEEYQKLFSDDRKEIGKCPRCGNKVYVGNRNYYCSGSDCNFTLWKNNRFFESQGKTLDEATVRKLLSEKQVHFKDLVSEKTKRKYEATIKMEVSETGNPKFQLIFPERKKGKKNEE